MVSTSSGQVLYVPQDVGLANRLRALVGYAAMSRCLFARPVRLHWTATHRCPALFDELFDSADVELLDAAQAGDVPPASVHTGEDWFHQIWSRELAERIPWQAYLREVQRFLTGLRAKGAITEAVHEFARVHQIGQAVGLHIRQTDNIPDYRTLQLNPTFDIRCITKVEGFRSLVEQDPEQTYFLATDSRLVQREFSRAYRRRIRRWPTRFSVWMRLLDKIQPNVGHRASSMQDALAEMLLLARCRRIVGTYYSSFGEFAAVWGLRDFSAMQGIVSAPHVRLKEIVDELRALERSAVPLGAKSAGACTRLRPGY